MAVNKVIYGNETLIDITDTTATDSTVLEGTVFYNAAGVRTVGSALAGISDVQNEEGTSLVSSGIATIPNEIVRINLGDIGSAGNLVPLEEFRYVTSDQELIGTINNAINAGKEVYLTANIYTSVGRLDITTPYQRKIYGDVWPAFYSYGAVNAERPGGFLLIMVGFVIAYDGVDIPQPTLMVYMQALPTEYDISNIAEDEIETILSGTTINGHQLSSSVNLTYSDVGAASASHTHTYSDVGAASASHTHTAADVGAVPTSRTVNGKALSSNITLTAADVGALSTFVETDPTVPAWAKAASKPTYTASEVGALSSNTTYVSTVNGQSGAVTVPDASAYILTYGGTVTFSEVLAAYNANRPIYVKYTDPEEGDLFYSPVDCLVNETNYYGLDCVHNTRLWEQSGTYTVGDYGTIHWNSTTGWSMDSVSVQIPTTYVRDVQDNSGTSIVSNGIATLPQIPTPTPQTTWYGWCSTLSTTAEKAVTCEGFTLVTGAIIGVYFDKGSNLAAPTLNVNSTGAKDIYVGSAVTNSTTNVLNWANDTIIYFIYDGIRYRYMTSTSSAAANASRGASTWYATCNSATTDTVKEALVQNYVLTKGSLIVIYFSNGNTSTSAISLNINSTGAKKIKVNGWDTSSKNLLWSGGTRLTFMYDGTDYQLISMASNSIPQRYNSSTNPNGYLTLADLPVYDGSVS